MDDLISVIIPVYNAEKYIDRCIQSIQNQSYDKFELILIDDGSKDNSLKLCQQYSNRDDRIVVESRENGGASAARNTGLKKSHGRYIVFVDIDDFVAPDYLKNLYLAAIEGDYDIVQCELQCTKDIDFHPLYVNYNSRDIRELTKTEALNNRIYKVSVWGKIYSSEIFKDFQFQEGIIYEDDASYYIFVDRARRIATLNETLYFYFMSENSVMRNSQKNKSIAFLKIYEDRIQYFKERNETELLDGTYDRFCLVLMLTYANSLHNQTNLSDIDTFLKTFRKYYRFVMKSKSICLSDKCMFAVFNVCPKAIGYIIGKIRE